MAYVYGSLGPIKVQCTYEGRQIELKESKIEFNSENVEVVVGYI